MGQLVEYLPGMQEALSSSPELCKQGMVASVYDPSTWDLETGRSEAQGNPQLRGEFQASLGYTGPSLNKKHPSVPASCIPVTLWPSFSQASVSTPSCLVNHKPVSALHWPLAPSSWGKIPQALSSAGY